MGGLGKWGLTSSRCHEIDYPPELAYPRGYSISIPIYFPPRKITVDGQKVTRVMA